LAALDPPLLLLLLLSSLSANRVASRLACLRVRAGLVAAVAVRRFRAVQYLRKQMQIQA
jgi:hypothetical protein